MEVSEAVSCKKGWYKLYLPIIREIVTLDAYADNVEEKIGISEIREKFGCLDIQVINRENLTPHLVRIIRNAMRKSECVCEFCGTEKHVGHTTNFWRKSVCNHCWKAFIKPNTPNSEWVDDSAITRANFEEEEE